MNKLMICAIAFVAVFAAVDAFEPFPSAECDAGIKNNVAAGVVKAYNKQRSASFSLKEITSCIEQPVIDGLFGRYTMTIKLQSGGTLVTCTEVEFTNSKFGGLSLDSTGDCRRE